MVCLFFVSREYSSDSQSKTSYFGPQLRSFSYLHVLELNIKMEVNVLNRQRVSELSLITSTLHRVAAQVVKKCCLREPVYFYNSSHCQMCKQHVASWDQFK